MVKLFIWIAAPLVIAPLLPGVINRVKAVFAGRQGPLLLQLYFDLWKLFRKGAVFSRTTTWVFRLGPAVFFASVLSVLWLLPFGDFRAPFSFNGDLIVFVYFLGLGRFMVTSAALDTGSSFEGMGASREVQFAVFSELAFFLVLCVLAAGAGNFSISGIFRPGQGAFCPGLMVRVLAAVVFFEVLLAENARLPVDDPNTHLELTMIHESMILDHSGPDMAFILWAHALKMWIFGLLVVQVIVPVTAGGIWGQAGVTLLAIFLMAVIVGIVESVMARLKLCRIPVFLLGASAIAVVAYGLSVMR